jgi:hypothetical protein
VSPGDDEDWRVAGAEDEPPTAAEAPELVELEVEPPEVADEQEPWEVLCDASSSSREGEPAESPGATSSVPDDDPSDLGEEVEPPTEEFPLDFVVRGPCAAVRPEEPAKISPSSDARYDDSDLEESAPECGELLSRRGVWSMRDNF